MKPFWLIATVLILATYVGVTIAMMISIPAMIPVVLITYVMLGCQIAFDCFW